MANALIICAAGMSSSLMAKKTTEFLKGKVRILRLMLLVPLKVEKLLQHQNLIYTL